jgi:hypothetical protein
MTGEGDGVGSANLGSFIRGKRGRSFRMTT